MTDTAPLSPATPDDDAPADQHDDFSATLVEFEAAPLQDALPETLDQAVDPVTVADNDFSTGLSFDTLLDIPVTVSAVLGRRKIDVESLTKLGAGSIIDLDRKVGDPVDLYINDQLIARGELVLADGGLGISMTEIIHPNNVHPSLSPPSEQE